MFDVAKRMRNTVLRELGGRMQRIGEGGRKTAGADRRPPVLPISSFLYTLEAEPGGEIGIGENGGAGVLSDLKNGIADMIGMSVGQKNMRDAGSGILDAEPRCGEGLIIAQKRVDKDFRLGPFHYGKRRGRA